MDIQGKQNIAAPRQQVWDALNDPAVLKQCLPGCESVERISAEQFKVVVATAIGPLRARFNGTLRMTEARPPEACVMVFEGQGGAVGFGKGQSSVHLAETSDGTELTYSAQAQVGGKLAQVGSRLIDSVARKMSDDFFKAFRRVLAPGEPGASTSAAAVLPIGSGQSAKPDLGASSVAPEAQGGSSTPSPTRPRPVPAAVASDPGVPAVPSTTVAGAAIGPSYSQPNPRPDAAPHAVLVPGWWLAVAAVLGSATTMVGVVLAR